MAMQHIGSVSGTGSSAIMTLTGVPDTYETLLLRGVGHSTNAASVEAYMRFNSDSGYVYDNLRGGRKDGATFTGNGANGSMNHFAYIPGTDQGSVLAQIEMDIAGYRAAADQPGVCGFFSKSNFMYDGSDNAQMIWTGWYDGSNVDITTISFHLSSGNWGTSSKFDLYGRTGE